MTRIERRAAIMPEYGRVSLLDICQETHGVLKGSYDGYLDDNELKRLDRFFSVVISSWEEGRGDAYSKAVLALVWATSELVELEIRARGILS